MRILVVEDERDVRELMLLHLKREGYDVFAAEEGEEAFRKLSSENFDLVLLDWMLPGISGLEICKRLRARSHEIPVLMVTARADSADIVLGLEMGADDYITKPFDIPVLLARVHALSRRSRTSSFGGQGSPLQIGELRVDVPAHRVFCGSSEIVLTPSEFKLLASLLENQGRVLSRGKLIDLIQGQDIAVVDRTVDTHVFGLRKKLGPCADVIETIRGVGYRVRCS